MVGSQQEQDSTTQPHNRTTRLAPQQMLPQWTGSKIDFDLHSIQCSSMEPFSSGETKQLHTREALFSTSPMDAHAIT